MSSSAVSAAPDPRIELALALVDADPDALPVVVGPTASGKTALAVALAERIGGEIISGDSVQIYRHFDVGSGKPTRSELARAPHHLVDALDPLDAIDAARFGELGRACIDEVRARGKRPIVCGGTFLWVRALLHGLADAPPADPQLRGRHKEIALREGRGALHATLHAVDPESAARLHPNDFVRVSRALEVHELTGRSLSAWQAEHAFRTMHHRPLLLAVAVAGDELTARIEGRAHGWLENGWIDEVRALVERGYDGARAMGSVGYKQVREHVRGGLRREELLPAIVRATRTLTRRQRTWLGHTDAHWLGREDR